MKPIPTAQAMDYLGPAPPGAALLKKLKNKPKSTRNMAEKHPAGTPAEPPPTNNEFLKNINLYFSKTIDRIGLKRRQVCNRPAALAAALILTNAFIRHFRKRYRPARNRRPDGPGFIALAIAANNAFQQTFRRHARNNEILKAFLPAFVLRP